MTKNGGTKEQCSTLASTTVDTITTAVSSQQGILNAIKTGNECADEGQDEVTSSKAKVVTAEADLTAKRGAAATALSAKDADCAATVDFSVNLDTLQVNECFDYKTQDSYMQKKNVCDSKTTAWKTANDAIAPAETSVNDAKSAAAAALTAASGLKVNCQCAAKKEQVDAWTAVQEGHASHAADWKQANEILCTLNAASTACNNLPCPAVTKPTLAAGVAAADCTEATSAGNCPRTCMGTSTCDAQIMAMVKNANLRTGVAGARMTISMPSYTCSGVESRYGCDCGGCLCDVDALSTAYPRWADSACLGNNPYHYCKK